MYFFTKYRVKCACLNDNLVIVKTWFNISKKNLRQKINRKTCDNTYYKTHNTSNKLIFQRKKYIYSIYLFIFRILFEFGKN